MWKSQMKTKLITFFDITGDVHFEFKQSWRCAFLNSAPRHEGVLGEWKYSSTHS
jgi:hypothetical protein